MRISILTNGPGELWGWVRPVIMELRKRGHSVSLWLLPCQFSSGHEREAASLLGVDKLEGPASAARIWHDMSNEKTDYVLQMGGDINFGLKLSRAAQVSLACYTYGMRKKIDNVKILTAFESQAEKIPGAIAIGDLVKDSLILDQSPGDFLKWNWPEKKDSPRVLFLPGSRPKIRKAVMNWLVEIKEDLVKKIPNVRIRTLFSQFMPENEFSQWNEAGLNPVKAGAGVAMKNSDYALTQPGTNNFELMHCGLPALVVGPEKFLDVVPVSGALGTFASIPFIGRNLKRIAVMRIIKRWGGVIALPNRISKEKIMDEIYGDITPEEIALKISQALSNPENLEKNKQELLKHSGPSGAAEKLCDLVSEK